MAKVARVMVAVLVAVGLLGGAAVVAAPPAVPAKSQSALALASSEPLPGNMARLQQELAVHSSIRYKILVMDDAGGYNLTDYIDRVADAWGEPAPDTLLLVLFAKENYNIRFFMGANLTQQGATVESMLKLLWSAYFPKSQTGDVAGGLARLISEMNYEYSGKMGFPPTNKQITGDAQKAITKWVNQYLHPFLLRTQPDHVRADSVGVEELRMVGENLYEITYMVQPAVAKGSDWLSKGKLDERGWVMGITQEVKLVDDDGELQVVLVNQ